MPITVPTKVATTGSKAVIGQRVDNKKGFAAQDQINTISQPRRYRLTATSCRHAMSGVFEQ